MHCIFLTNFGQNNSSSPVFVWVLHSDLSVGYCLSSKITHRIFMQPISPISVRSCDCSVLFFVVYLQGSELGSKCVCSTPAGSGGEKEGAREEVGLTNSWSPSWPQDLTPSDQQPGTETSAENPELRRLHKDSRRIVHKFVLLLSFCYPFAILLPSVCFPFANRLLSFCDPIRLLSVLGFQHW